MNQYELKQAAKKERYAELAKKRATESDAIFKNNKEMLSGLPFGQPILVGHHSEARHRRMLKRSDALMRKAVELDQQADYYAAKATTTSNAISADDEDAITKLKTKLAKLETTHTEMKRINQQFRKGGFEAITDISDERREYLKKQKAMYPRLTCLFEPYELSNSNAKIARIKARIAQLEKEQARPTAKPLQGDGYLVVENKEDNRIWFTFDSKPSSTVCQLMRQHGFKWSPTRKVLNVN